MVKITKEEIDEIFKNAREQADYLIELYKKVFPNWDNIEKVEDFPKAGKEINNYIMGKAIAYDREHHPDVLNGGLWMNNGFSGLDSKNVDDWEVQPCEVTLKTPE